MAIKTGAEAWHILKNFLLDQRFYFSDNLNLGSILENQNIREGIKAYSDWPTIPQLYVKNEFVGGCDIIKEMYENGELAKLFEDKNIAFKKKN